MKRREFLKALGVATATSIPGGAFAATRLNDPGENLARANLANADLSGRDLSGWCLAGADLRGANLSNAKLIRTDLRDVRLDGAQMAQATLAGARLAGAVLSDAGLQDANLSYTDLRGIDWTGAKLDSAEFCGADMTGADLRQIDPDCGTIGKNHSILWLNLSGSHDARTRLDGANLSNLRGFFSLFNISLRSALLRGIRPNDLGREGQILFEVGNIDVSGADLTGADLRTLFIIEGEVTAFGTNFTEVKFSDWTFFHDGVGVTNQFLDDLRGENPHGAIIRQTEIEGILYG